MKQSAAARKAGFIVVSLVFLFALSTAAEAAGTFRLGTMLRSQGVSMKLVRLDRVDGFLFGLSFKGPGTPSMVIAPGFNRSLLLEVDGNEMIFQNNGTGSMQVIQAEGDIGYAMCILTTVIDFFTNVQTCQGDTLCLFNQVISLITGIRNCGTPEA